LIPASREGRARRAASAAAPLLAAATLAIALGGCARSRGTEPIRLWAMGREGEVVQELTRDFERDHPGIRVEVQQIPWSAAHEKLLTAHVGHSTPDVAMLGNTWIAEFAALRALEPLEPWMARSAAVAESSYFAGIWDTNVVDGVAYGIPWYVDTRVLFYRRDLLERAGYDSIPGSWDGWTRAMQAVTRLSGKGHYAIFLPTNEYTPWIVFGLQTGSPMLRDHDTRGAFSEPSYRRALGFALGLFHDGLAPPVQGSSIANVYQEFERGTFAMYITGPWQVGEFRNRVSPSVRWDTAALPGPDGPASGVSTAGGSSLVVFRGSKHKAEAWQLIEYLSRPEQQVRFYRLTGDLPARREAWRDTALTNEPHFRAFEIQLQRVVSTPKIPEWEQIAILLREQVEAASLGGVPPDSAMARLDREVDRILEKRRWLLAREAERAARPAAAGAP
jgi:multiple sugar transport system substrate-binding protein